MKTNKIFIVLFGVLLTVFETLHAQPRPDSDFPIPGKPCPELSIQNIEFAPIKHGTIAELRQAFKGKWLIIDFWDKACSSCIAGFPELNKMQKEFKDKIQWILVGKQDKSFEIRPLYERYRKKLKLNLVAAFDSSIFTRLELHTVPHMVIIDPDGVVKGVTARLSRSEIYNLIEGKPVSLEPDKLRWAELTTVPQPYYDFTNKIPYLSGGNGGPDSLAIYRAVVSSRNNVPYRDVNGELVYHHERWFENVVLNDCKQLYFLNWPLKKLYEIAYCGWFSTLSPNVGREAEPYRPQERLYGSFNNQQIFLQTRDSSVFGYEGRMNDTTHLFCISIELPRKSTVEQYQVAMISALDQAFKYKSLVQTRKMPYWKLILKNQDKRNNYLTTGGKNVEIRGHEKFACHNRPISLLISWLLGTYSPNIADGSPIIDETGIKGNIDLEVEGSYLDWDERLKSLRAKGFDLVKGYKDMQVLVIRDAQPSDIKLPVPLN